MSSFVLLSIKPKFAGLIAKEEKKIELRKKLPKNLKTGDYIILYVSSPVKEIRGAIVVSNVITDTPNQIWLKFKEHSAISHTEFQEYFLSCDIAHAIEIKKYFGFKSIPLEDIKKQLSDFVVPQNFRYISKTEMKSIGLKALPRR